MSRPEPRPDVLIVGAGPTGLFLADRLAAQGVGVLVVERRDRPDESPKGNGIIGHAALLLRRLGVLQGTGCRVVQPPRFMFGPIDLRLGFGPRNPLHLVAIPQRRLEHILEERALAHGVRIRRGAEVVSFEQDSGAVTVRLHTSSGEEQSACGYLVGCDGARSVVRKTAGIGYPGFTSDAISRIARVTIPDEAVTRGQGTLDIRGVGTFSAFRPNRAVGGGFSIAPAATLDKDAPKDLYIVATHEPREGADPDVAPSLDGLRASLARVLGADLPFTQATALRATVGNSRQADAYRKGRILLAGDAAHIFNAGGSSLNAGLLDAFDLAPRLSAAISDPASDAPLDGYEAVRRAACDRTLAHTRLQSALNREDDQGSALRVILPGLLRSRAACRALARIIEGAPETATA